MKKKNVMERLSELFESDCDPSGSYTGTPQDGGMPEQDADDL